MQDYQKEYTDEQEHSMKRPDLCGLGGWLILVGFSLVTSLFLVGKRLFDLYSFITGEEWFLFTNTHSEFYHPMWKPCIFFETSINIILFLLLITLIICFFTKKKSFPKLMIFMYMFVVITSIIDYILILQIPLIYEAGDTSTFSAIIRASITASIWITYFIKSIRVKNTFVK